ncbi:MAG TPA: hypothetical protein P5560_13415, partial [Thermotogota bacterium]|nr:hypothetical protein [Thermotogota bacterium]
NTGEMKKTGWVLWDEGNLENHQTQRMVPRRNKALKSQGLAERDRCETAHVPQKWQMVTCEKEVSE